jgi:hypothetical protein
MNRRWAMRAPRSLASRVGPRPRLGANGAQARIRRIRLEDLDRRMRPSHHLIVTDPVEVQTMRAGLGAKLAEAFGA